MSIQTEGTSRKAEGKNDILAKLETRVSFLERKRQENTANWKRYVSTHVDGNSDGRVGSVRIAWLVVLAALTLGAFAANELVWSVVPDIAFVDAEGDATFNSVTADITATTITATTITADTVTGTAASDEVLSMGYSTLNTDVTLAKGGSFFVTTGAAMTITLPDPATVLGKSLRIVVAGDGGDLTVNGALTSHYYVAGDGGATDSSAVLDDALDMIEIQAISTVLWGVLDQTGVSSYTTR